jgi:2-alkenal reductase
MTKQKLVTLFVVLAFVCGVIVGVVAVEAQGGERLGPLPVGGPYNPTADELALAQVYEQVINSIVSVSVSDGNGMLGTGSGFVIDTDGHIVTNNHVVAEAEFVEVVFRDGSIVQADLVGRDPDADLAVVRVDPAEVALQPLTFADSDQVFVGQQVMAIGSPFGEEQAFTVTTGIVSGLGRSLQNTDRFSIPELIQTDAAINPGNSGGPLLDLAGNVVGVNTAILTATRTGSGVGFAIPSNTVRRIVPYLIANGEYAHAWLGISGTTLVPAQRDAMNLPADLRGVMVSEVAESGPAEQAGLLGTTQVIQTPFGPQPVEGDIITAINGEPVSTMEELIGYLEDNTLPGDTVTLTVWRAGEFMDIQVPLAGRPAQRQF